MTKRDNAWLAVTCVCCVVIFATGYALRDRQGDAIVAVDARLLLEHTKKQEEAEAKAERAEHQSLMWQRLVTAFFEQRIVVSDSLGWTIIKTPEGPVVIDMNESIVEVVEDTAIAPAVAHRR